MAGTSARIEPAEEGRSRIDQQLIFWNDKKARTTEWPGPFLYFRDEGLVALQV
jgi:hypothetical protein